MNYNELMKLLEENGIKRADFCKASGVTTQQMTNAKKTNTQFSAATMEKISKYFKKPLGCLYDSNEEYEQAFYEAHAEQIKVYRANNEARAIAEAYMDAPEAIKDAVAKLLDIKRDLSVSREA